MAQNFNVWIIFCLSAVITALAAEADVNLLGDHLQVRWAVLENPPDDKNIICKAEITLTNMGPEDFMGSDWEIHFCSVRLMFPNQLRGTPKGTGHLIPNSNIMVYHLNGCMTKLKPNSDFVGFKQNKAIVLPIETSDWSVSRTDVMPNWFVTDASGGNPKTIVSTANQELDFVADFDSPEKWKRIMGIDQYNPFSPEDRFDRNTAPDLGKAEKRVLPTPVSETYDDSQRVDISTGDWVIVYASQEVKPDAEYLAAKWNTDAVNTSQIPSSRYVRIEVGDVKLDDTSLTNQEAYDLNINPDSSVITITGVTPQGAFFGIQSLLSLASQFDEIPKTHIVDYPRFPYRGMHVDVGRNFHGKESIMKILDAMAMYKLNNFYFHITDDEGWRLEIDGLEELTSIGAHRCFDMDGDECIMPQLGSGPTKYTSGSGYYTKEEYREILRYANERHIRVVPEFDMPGHMHAAIKAMEARNDSYLLTDYEDTSNYLSVQWFRDNAVNPCMPTTYNFVRKVAEEIKALHSGIQDLDTFNFGGDEVSGDAWVNSTACDEYIKMHPELKPDIYTSKNTILHRHFVENVSQIAHELELNLDGWEDGLKFNNSAIERNLLPNENVTAFMWNNVWEWGWGSRAYEYANEGYKVVISHATHFYFDHPQEPDPEERGFYWATRVTDISKTFGYYADDVYQNINEDVFGRSLTKDDVCGDDMMKCIQLEDDKRSNIIGIQGHLWSETVRTTDQLESNIFPRMLAMAERAWHKASWEDLSACGENCNTLKANDWAAFANTLGYKELRRLSDMDIKYYVPPPGAKRTLEDGNSKLEVNVDLPGQQVVYSTDGGDTWQTIKPDKVVILESDPEIIVAVRSADLSRSGRRVVLRSTTPGMGVQVSPYLSVMTFALMLLVALLK